MKLRDELETFWTKLQTVRGGILDDIKGLSQAQFDWRPQEGEWSIGEVVHHLALAETATGKLQTRMLRAAEAAGTLRPYVDGIKVIDALPSAAPGRPTGAPPHVWPQHGRAVEELLGEITAVRERTRLNLERFAEIDPRPLVWDHVIVGPIHLGQFWTIMGIHDPIHVPQIRAVKTSPGFPR